MTKTMQGGHLLSLDRPSRKRVERFLAEQEDQTFSYGHVGVTRRGSAAVDVVLAAGFRMVFRRFLIGRGEYVYRRAVQSFYHWEMFNLGWVDLCCPHAPLAPDTTVAILGKAVGVWSINACRMVYLVDEVSPLEERFGFALGTLPNHTIMGEERMVVEWKKDDDTVWYEIFSFSKARDLLMRVNSPLVRILQKRFARESAAHLVKYVNR